MAAIIPVVAAVIGAYGASRAASKNKEAAQMQLDASKTQSNGPTVMPLADGEAVQAAKKQSILDQISGRGRASTLLTDTGDQKLGGG